MNIFQKIKYAIQISDNDQFLKAIENKDSQIKDLQTTITNQAFDKSALQSKYNALQLLIPKTSDIDKYCQKNFTEIPLIAYKQKRKIIGRRYTISLHELITPDSWSINSIQKGIGRKSDRLEQFTLYGDLISTLLTWTSDENLDTSGDYYLYPNETLALTKGDCEDHAFVNCSLDLEIGGAWGFFNKTTGHAFNCFIYKDELYVLDTVGNKAVIVKYSDQLQYKIHYIITKEHAYCLDSSVVFGEIAGW